MAKGREKHQARLDEIGLLGKDLARRASQKCELCEGKDDLRAYDTAPDDPPTLDTIALLCARCRGLAEGKKAPAETLRFLESAIWSPYPGVAKTAREALAKVDADWARMALEMLG
ncbi:MAG: hypothetical protein R3B82_17695 [Sandaracinaceae bacterium]